MVNILTAEGRCPICTYKIARQDKDSVKVVFMAIKSMRINTVDGSATGECPRCKNGVELPDVKVPNLKDNKTTKSNINANSILKTTT